MSFDVLEYSNMLPRLSGDADPKKGGYGRGAALWAVTWWIQSMADGNVRLDLGRMRTSLNLIFCVRH